MSSKKWMFCLSRQVIEVSITLLLFCFCATAFAAPVETKEPSAGFNTEPLADFTKEPSARADKSATNKKLAANKKPGLLIDQSLPAPQVLLDTYQKNKTNNSSFNLFSHGRSGELLIEGQWLSGQALVEYLKPRLLGYAQLNVYGCEFAKGEKGKAAVAFLEQQLGVSVAASDDITGVDGDWDLEVGVASNSMVFNDYQYNLQSTLDYQGCLAFNTISAPADGSLGTAVYRSMQAGEVLNVNFTISGTGISSGRPIYRRPSDGDVAPGAALGGSGAANVSDHLTRLTFDRPVTNFAMFLVWANDNSPQRITAFSNGVAVPISNFEFVGEISTVNLVQNTSNNSWDITGNPTVPSRAGIRFNTPIDRIDIRPIGNANFVDVRFGCTFDYADGPASYGDAEHRVRNGSFVAGRSQNFPDNNESGIFIHEPADGEGVAAHTADATGDGDDEDEVVFTNTGNVGSSYAVDLEVSNISTAQTGRVIGWIDFNQNGTFESSEASNVQTIPADVSDVTRRLRWSVPPNQADGNYFVRLRASQDSNLTTAMATGLLISGEAEDYQVAFSFSPDTDEDGVPE